jgi:hypothetical protein
VTNLTISGLLSWLCGGLLLLFQGIASMMGTKDIIEWKSLTVLNIVGENNFEWLDAISWITIQQAITFIVNLPLYLLFFCVGIIFLVVNVFKPKI